MKTINHGAYPFSLLINPSFSSSIPTIISGFVCFTFFTNLKMSVKCSDNTKDHYTKSGLTFSNRGCSKSPFKKLTNCFKVH